MKRKIIISLIMTILMVSTIAAGAINSSTCVSPGTLCDPYPIEVEKKVWDGEGWADSTEADLGDTVRFKITITYYKTGVPNGYKAINISVIDTLPHCLEYDNNANYLPTYIEGKEICWNLTDDYGIELFHTDSVSIEFDAYVIDFGENVNHVKVNATERCSGVPLYGEDEATVIVEEEPWIEVIKTVWDGEEWVKELDGVKKGEPVRFQIKITYHGETPMKCLEVTDILPEPCLIYADNEKFIYPNSIIEDPEIWVSGDLTEVIWDWANKAFYLEDNETIIIRFDAKVIDYCYCWVENWVFVKMWGCDIYLEGSDFAKVHCVPPDWEFDKKVWDPTLEMWVEEANVYVGDIIQYKIDLTYYGNDNLTEVQIIDVLPCIILYEGNANIEETGVSSDLKTTWWNLTEIDISDGETLSIIFDALVTGQSGDCQECGINTAYFYSYEKSGEDTAKIHSTHKDPAEFSIKIKSGWRKAKAIVTNAGGSVAEDIYWTISLNGGRMHRIQASNQGFFTDLLPGQGETINTAGKTKLGFGRATVEVALYENGGEEPIAIKTVNGFILGPLVLIRDK